MHSVTLSDANIIINTKIYFAYYLRYAITLRSVWAIQDFVLLWFMHVKYFSVCVAQSLGYMIEEFEK